jgi:chemotaxis signal transduction protein
MRLESVRILKCYAEGRPYCVDVEQVLAIERRGRLKPNPEAEGPIGWIARRERPIPVFSLAELLGCGDRNSEVGAVLVMNRTSPWGLAVDRVSRFEGPAVPPQSLPPSMGHLRADCFRGVMDEGGSLILQLSPERLRPGAAPAPVSPVEPVRRAAPKPAPGAQTSPGRLLLISLRNSVPPSLLPATRSKLLVGLSYTQVVEIVSGIETTPVPLAPAHVLGLIRWRARPVTVLDAGVLLGLEPMTLDAGGRLLIVRSLVWQTPIAIPVGAIETQVLPMPHRPSRLSLDLSSTLGAFDIGDDQVLVVPDVDAIAGPVQ